jgi:hypothetical protein
MKRAALAILAVGLFPFSLSAEPFRFGFFQNTAWVTSNRTEGCIRTTVTVSVFGSSPGTLNEHMPMIVDKTRFDDCHGGRFVGSATGFGNASVFTVDKNLKSAHAEGTVIVNDFPNPAYPVTVNLDWSRDGQIARTIKYRDQSLTYFGIGMQRATGELANAVVAGTVFSTLWNRTIDDAGGMESDVFVTFSPTTHSLKMPVATGPATIHESKALESVADAIFFAGDHCVSQIAGVHATQDFANGGAATLLVFISSADFCTGRFLDVNQTVTIPESAFSIAPNLSRARITASVLVTDLDTGASIPVDIDVEMNGILDRYHVRDFLTLRTAEGMVRTDFNGRFVDISSTTGRIGWPGGEATDQNSFGANGVIGVGRGIIEGIP